MKKLIIACAAVLVLGLGLTTVGHVLGGQFYSVYYNGALHPFSDAAQNFSDKFVNISDHRNAIEHGDMPIQSVDQIDYIDLALNGGEFTIENGSDFAVSASVNFADTQINGTHWTASLWANDEPATITLPRDGNYLQIRISCGQQANVIIRDRLSAQNIELSAGNGTLTADELYGHRITLDATDGRLSATLPESADQYHVRATANWGTVIMNGTPLVQMDELGNGTVQYDNRAEHVPHDLQARVSGSGQISLLSQIASTNADTPV